MIQSTRTPPGQPMVKGLAFRTIDRCYTELRGPGARDAARNAMPIELCDAFRYGTILAASWYPIDWYRQTLTAFRLASGDGPELARDIGKLAARHDMAAVYKQVFAKLVSPQALLAMSQRMFNTYYDTGRFEIVESRKGFVHARCRNCLGWDQNMWMELLGSCEALLEIAGAGSVRLRLLAGGTDGESHAELEARWA
jgi:hypothetical protein